MRDFYFSLPRLLVRLSGGRAERSEKNGLEANLVGGFEHLVIYLCAFEFCLTSLPWWQQLLFSLPLALAVWIFWLILFYLNSLLIRLLRACGIFPRLPQSRAQGILIGTLATAAAFLLFRAGDWMAWPGGLWLGMAALNLSAAALLALIPARPAVAS